MLLVDSWRRLLFVLRLSAVLGLILMASACAPRSTVAAAPDEQAAEKPKGPVGNGDPKAAPEFALKDGEGRVVKLSDYRGKVVLLNFWATWCGPCKVEVPWFIEFEKKYKGRGFAVLAVSMDDDGWAGIKAFMAEEKVNYRVLLYTEQVSAQYGGIESLPTTFIIDPQGRIAATHEGLVSKHEYEKDIEALLAGANNVGAGRGIGGALRPVRADQ